MHAMPGLNVNEAVLKFKTFVIQNNVAACETMGPKQKKIKLSIEPHHHYHHHRDVKRI